MKCLQLLSVERKQIKDFPIFLEKFAFFLKAFALKKIAAQCQEATFFALKSSFVSA